MVKNSELVAGIKAWVDEEYAGGRVTVLTDEEIVACLKRVCGEKGIDFPGEKSDKTAGE